MNRGAWWATVHGVTKSWTRLKQLCLLTCIVALQCGVSLCRAAKLISYKFAYILPSWASLSPPPPSLPSRSSQNTELPVLCSRCPLATRDICTHGSLHVSVPIFQFIPPTPSTRPSSTTAVSCREYESYLNKTVKGGEKVIHLNVLKSQRNTNIWSITFLFWASFAWRQINWEREK